MESFPNFLSDVRVLFAMFAVCIVWYFGVVSEMKQSCVLNLPRWLSGGMGNLMRSVGEKVLGLSLEHNVEELSTQQSLLGVHPHGVLCTASTFFGGYLFNVKMRVKGRFMFPCVADVLFRIPIVGEFCLLNGARSMNHHVLDRLLQCGNSIAMYPGGMYEQVHTEPSAEVLYFAPKLGFIRVAIRNGVPLQPSYVFGENQLYSQNCLTRFLNRSMKRFFGLGSFFMVGRFGLLWPVCRPRPLYWHFGSVIDVGCAEAAPSEERVREVFVRYVAELQRIFKDHAPEHLPADVAAKGLTIVWRVHDKAWRTL